MCSLSNQDRIPKFFRVTNKDLLHFPKDTFSSLQLTNSKTTFSKFYSLSLGIAVTALSKIVLSLSLKIDLEFYYNEFDWGLIYRYILSLIRIYSFNVISEKLEQMVEEKSTNFTR